LLVGEDVADVDKKTVRVGNAVGDESNVDDIALLVFSEDERVHLLDGEMVCVDELALVGSAVFFKTLLAGPFGDLEV